MGNPEEYTAKRASTDYFLAIRSMLDEFRNEKNKEAKTLGEVAAWLDKYARKIDRLPIGHVYDELLDYGEFVSSNLRDASMAYKGIGIKSRVATLEANAQAGNNSYYYGYGGGYRFGRYGWYGEYYNPTAAQQQRLEKRAKVRSEGATEAIKIMDSVYEAERKVLRQVKDNHGGVDVSRY